MTKMNWDRVNRENATHYDPPPMSPKAGRFQAKYKGTCAICGAKFPTGTPCAFTLRDGRKVIAHGACL